MLASFVHSLNGEGLQSQYALDQTLSEVRVPRNSSVYLNLYSSRVQAGFPSPADDYVEKTLDLNDYLINHPTATFFVCVSGDSMIGAGIHHQDILVVDRSLQPKDRDIVIAALNGELTVKRLKVGEAGYILRPENPDYPEIPIHDEIDCCIWGVVTSVIHRFR